MNTFKRGDKVKWNGHTRTVSSTSGGMVYFEGGNYGVRHEHCTYIGKFKPGDVVKIYTGSEHTIGCLKTVYEDGARPYTGETAYDYVGGGWDRESSLTLVRTAEQAILGFIDSGRKIEAMKHHRIATGDGLLEAKNAIEAIVAQRSILGRALVKPKFKVGDRVKLGDPYDGDTGTVTSCDGDSFMAKWDNGRGNDNSFGSSHATLVKSPPAIVARKIDGLYQPTANPMVHASAAIATKEAERLAVKHPGATFGTFVLANTSTATAPVTTTVSV